MPSTQGFVQGYNAQAAVDIESQLIVHAHVTQATNDKQQIVPALEALQALPESLGVLSEIVADAGYYSEANAVACEEAGVMPYLASQLVRCQAAQRKVGTWRGCQPGRSHGASFTNARRR